MTWSVAEILSEVLDAIDKIPPGSQDRRPDETYDQWHMRVVAPALGLDEGDESV
jgi:hypothetical protein